MAIDLSKPLDDTVISTQEKAFLRNLQANILKGHGRDHVALVFLEIEDVPKARKYLRAFPVSDAHTQLLEARQFDATLSPGGVVRLVHLSQTGLAKLGHKSSFAQVQPFADGMASDTQVLDGGNTVGWQAELRKPIDVLLVLAYHHEVDFASMVGKLVGDLEDDASGFKLRFVQQGRGYRNKDNEGVEHFGYVDGRSQPLLLVSQIKKESTKVYNPTAPLSQVLVDDPLSPGGFGSFFVFRKLEQNVAGFKQAEEALARKLGLVDPDDERAGAQVVGRFEDGTPLTLHASEQGVPVLNDFDYSGDANGSRCPFHAHIRKSNPRGSSPGGPDFDKSVQMARRGITYGCRLQDPKSKEFIDQPNDGVGLLFMSYQSSIQDQFRFMQVHWVNDENFPHTGVGIDPVIGQGGNLPQTWFPTYGSVQNPMPSLFKGFVTLKGGEYFYTPSVAGLKNV
jgi:Dyp-type peroxidase family